jgi:hypothetical protein
MSRENQQTTTQQHPDVVSSGFGPVARGPNYTWLPSTPDATVEEVTASDENTSSADTSGGKSETKADRAALTTLTVIGSAGFGMGIGQFDAPYQQVFETLGIRGEQLTRKLGDLALIACSTVASYGAGELVGVAEWLRKKAGVPEQPSSDKAK